MKSNQITNASQVFHELAKASRQQSEKERQRGNLGVVLAGGRQSKMGRGRESETESTLKGIKVAFGCRSRNLIKDLCLCFIQTHTHTDTPVPIHTHTHALIQSTDQLATLLPSPRSTNPLSRPRTVLIFSACDLQFQFQFQFGSHQVDSSLLSLSYLFVCSLCLSLYLFLSLSFFLSLSGDILIYIELVIMLFLKNFGSSVGLSDTCKSCPGSRVKH